jgi:hypothetical protein
MSRPILTTLDKSASPLAETSGSEDEVSVSRSETERNRGREPVFLEQSRGHWRVDLVGIKRGDLDQVIADPRQCPRLRLRASASLQLPTLQSA